MEKTNAVVAAFTVTGLFSLLFIEMVATVMIMFQANTDYPNIKIAHNLCKARTLICSV